jgi:predicted thioesterase
VISEIDRKRVVFNVYVRSGVTEIARGLHERLLVSRTAFMEAIADK